MKGKHFIEKTKMNLISKIFILICIIIFLYSAYQVIYWVKSNNNLKKIEEQLVSEVVQELEDEETITKVIDFEKLMQINNDVIGWISIDNTQINYPILQTTDNEYYLNRDLYKQSSTCGSIFLDYNTKSDFSEQNTVIYGHHLKSGGMFTDLDKIYNGDLGDEVYITIYTKEDTYNYQVVASYISKQSLEIVKKSFTKSERELYLKNAIENSKIKFKSLLEEEEEILTLITCHGKQRIVVNAIKILGG